MRTRLPLWHRTWATATLAGAAVAVVGGCTTAGTQDGEAGPAQAYIDLALDISREESERRHMRYQEAIAACMAEAGFEYVPNLSGLIFIDEFVDPPRGSREYAQRYGYGFGSRPPGPGGTFSVSSDPNDEITSAMSEAELTEYYLALDGTWFEEFLEAGAPADFEADWSHSGCRGLAEHEALGSAPYNDPTFLALRAEIDRIDAQVVPTHPEVIAADAAWSECMADAGFPGFVRQPDAETRMREYSDAMGAVGGAIGSDELTDAERESVPEEVPLATADWDCTDQTGYHDVVARVRNAAQQEYVDAHRDELDAWVTEFGSAGDQG